MYQIKSADGGDLADYMEVVVAKNRYAEEGSVNLEFVIETADCRSIGASR